MASCTASGQTAGNGYTTTTCSTNNTGPTAVQTCTSATAAAGNNWTATTCAANTTATPEVYDCQPVAASAANNWTSTACGATLPGKEVKSRVGTTVTTSEYSGSKLVNSDTAATLYDPVNGYAATDGICVPIGSTLVPGPVQPVDRPVTTNEETPTVPANVGTTTYTSTCADNGASWPCTLVINTAGSANSLADVAQYYYATDLRTGPSWDSNLAATPPTKNDNVPAAGTGPEDDSAPWQHMTTYTIALGVSGNLNYSKTYKDDSSGDFADIRTGNKAWPVWPNLALDYANNGALYSNPKSIDDFWHTAVNGRGRYFSAGRPSDVVDGLRAVLNDLGKKQGSGAAAASSSQTPVQGNNIGYVAKYATTAWTGEIEAREIDLTNGVVKPAVLWSAQALLDVKAGYYCDNRKIYLFHSGASNNMVDFKWNSGACSIETIAESTTTTVTAGTVTSVSKIPQTATAKTGAAAARDLNVGDAILANDVVVTSAGASVIIDHAGTPETISGGSTTTVTSAGIVTVVNKISTATATTGASTRNLNVGDGVLANDVVVTSAGASLKVEHVGSLATTLDTTEQAYFGSAKVALLSQFPDMSDGTDGNPNQRALADDDNLVNFVRGQRGREGFIAKDAVRLYRKRDHILGDFVDAQPIFVAAPFASYKDTGYTTFKEKTIANGGQKDRKAMLYAAANDGMLHAFYSGVVSYDANSGTTTIDATGGQEAWAFIPSTVLGNLYKLADNDYANRHTFSVDGTPAIGDVYDATAAAWKTLLVAGLNKGGKGYYALDVTDPDNPKALWEFKWSNTCYDVATSSTHGADCHLGYTFGKPVISKLNDKDHTWVVLVTSGYNNVSGQAAGDGGGYLYVLNAMTGRILSKIATGAGNSTTPSGLAQINNFVDAAMVDNTTKYVYGGDNNGNVWRFNVNETPASAVLLGTATDSGGLAQPVTTRPELGEIAGRPWVFVGTGRLLGQPDLTDVHTQSVYGFIDTLSSETVYPGGLRGALRPLAMTPKTVANANPSVGTKRTVSCTGSDTECLRASGWVVDLPDDGERVSVEPSLELGTLFFASNVPRNTACNIGGYSWLNFLNFRTGLAMPSSPGGNVSEYLGESLAVGLTVLRLPPPASDPNGQGKIVVVVMGSSGTPQSFTPPVDVPAPLGKRVSWREVIQ